MASTSYSLPHASVMMQGWNPQNTTYIPCKGTSNASNGRLLFGATGTDCTIILYGGSWDIYIDGTFSSNTGTLTAADHTITLFTGLSDALHQVEVRQVLATNGTYYVKRSNTITVTGASPAISYPSGRGTNYVLATNTSSLQFEGVTWSTDSTYNRIQVNRPDRCIRFTVTATGALSIKIWAQLTLQTVILKDPYGDEIGRVTNTANGPGLGEMVMCTAATQTTGEYMLWFVGGNNATWIVTDLEILNGTLGSQPATRTYVCGFGDSITQGTSIAQMTSERGFIHRIGTVCQYAINNCGINGARVYDGTNAMQLDARVTEVLTYPPKILVIYGGVNDIGGGVSAANFGTAYQTMLQKLLDGVTPLAGLSTSGGTDKIICLSIRTDSGGTYNTAIQNAIAAVTLPANPPAIIYLDQTATGWAVSGDFPDSVHPSERGHLKMATMLMHPRTGYVLSTEKFQGAQITGTLTLPTNTHVLNDQTYGVSGTGSTGTLTLPTASKVLETNGAYGVGGTGTTPLLAQAKVMQSSGGNILVTDVRSDTSTGLAAGGTMDMTTYTLKSSVVSPSYVVTGHDNYTGGSAGTYPTTATSKAEQLAADYAKISTPAAGDIKKDVVAHAIDASGNQTTVTGTLAASTGGGSDNIIGMDLL